MRAFCLGSVPQPAIALSAKPLNIQGLVHSADVIPMRASVVIKIPIERPYAVVYEFLADPMNFAKWAANPDSEMLPLDGGEWLVELPRGQSVIRFAPRNNFGV